MKKSVTELAKELLEQANTEVDQFNELYDENEKLANENSFIKLQLKTVNDKLAETVKAANALQERYNILDAQSSTVLDNGEKHLNTAQQAYRERDQMKDKLDSANELLKAYKVIDTPKKIIEKIKDYKAKVAKGITDLNESKEVSKKLRREQNALEELNLQLKTNEVQSNITTMWSDKGDSLLLFPSRLTMQVGDHVENQITLLYMNQTGCGKLIGLDEDGLPMVCKMPPGGLKPKAKTLEVAGEMLRKWKRQDWKLTTGDLDLGSK